jgi:hypothetical protein
MSTVFISYRRQTAPGEARAIFSSLAGRLGQSAVFMDVDSISLGRDFRNELQKTLAACDFMLVIIDKDWAGNKDEKGRRRLENPHDYVRMEIETALKRDIVVTPVLVKGAQMPDAEELPAEIRDLVYRNAFELTYNRWESDVQEMIRRLGLDLPKREGPRPLVTHPTFILTVGGGPDASNPSMEDLASAVEAAGARNEDRFLILQRTEEEFIQALNDPDEGWQLEYRAGQLQFICDEPLATDQVIMTMQLYRDDNTEWAKICKWRVLNL